MKKISLHQTILASATTASLFVFNSIKAFAADVDLGIKKSDIQSGNFTFGDGDIGKAIGQVINIVLIIAGLAAFMYILWGAFNYVTAGDDPGKTEKARRTITNAVVGLVLVALSYVIWLIVANLTGISTLF